MPNINKTYKPKAKQKPKAKKTAKKRKSTATIGVRG